MCHSPPQAALTRTLMQTYKNPDPGLALGAIPPSWAFLFARPALNHVQNLTDGPKNPKASLLPSSPCTGCPPHPHPVSLSQHRARCLQAAS